MRILIVDDNRLNLQIAKDILIDNKLSNDILFSENGDQALETLEKESIDIVLLDIVMPGISGIEVLSAIKSKPKYKNIQVIMLTSLNDKRVLEECFETGANDFINKPIEKVEFISRLKAAFRVREYQKSLSETMELLTKQNHELKLLAKKLKETQYHLVQKEKMAAIGELAAGVAHEINNPLGFISSNFETLTKYLNSIEIILLTYMDMESKMRNEMSESKEVVKMLEDIQYRKDKLHIDFILKDVPTLIRDSQEGVERVSNIVKTLRNFSVSEPSEGVSYADIGIIIEEVLVILKNEIDEGINIKVAKSELPLFSCNHADIAIVIYNILTNAIQAIKSQPDAEQCKINIRTFEKDGYIACEIEDNGPGMDEATAKSIFNPFFTTKDVGEGMGLGLSVSYDIVVNKHNGELFVESKPGKGTIFTIMLPIKTIS